MSTFTLNGGPRLKKCIHLEVLSLLIFGSVHAKNNDTLPERLSAVVALLPLELKVIQELFTVHVFYSSCF